MTFSAKEVKAALADEGVQAAIAKQITAERKAVVKQASEVIKAGLDDAKSLEDKVQKAAVTAALKQSQISIRELAIA